MNNTLFEKELVISTKVNKISYQDVIVFKHQDKTLIKRVIGLPNDKIVIDDNGYVYVNDVKLEEPYLTYNVGLSDITYPFIVPEDELFVLGDNRSDSLDSRVTSFKTVKYNEVIGKVDYSLSKMHKIK